MSAANGCGHRGKGDGWKATRSSHVRRSLTRRGCYVTLWLKHPASSPGQFERNKRKACMCALGSLRVSSLLRAIDS
jgi:hypothetical protein